MALTESKYYFSLISVLFATFLILVLTAVFVTFIYFSFTYGYAGAIILSCLSGLLLLLSLPKYLKFLFFLTTNRPALILTKHSLIDNVNGLDIQWSEIKTISYQLNRGKILGGHTAITVIDPDKYILTDSNPFGRLIKRINTNYFGGTFSIPHNSIKCNSTKLIDDLRKFHDAYK